MLGYYGNRPYFGSNADSLQRPQWAHSPVSPNGQVYYNTDNGIQIQQTLVLTSHCAYLYDVWQNRVSAILCTEKIAFEKKSLPELQNFNLIWIYDTEMQDHRKKYQFRNMHKEMQVLIFLAN